jgi:AcrR family transcriptional regulator
MVGAARELFAANGYTATSMDAVVAKAGVTKGALYHHFAGKRGLFAAVYEREQVKISGALIAAAVHEPDPCDAFTAACRAFIELCREPGTERILLLDALAALGWEAARRIESPSLRLIERGIERAIDAGRIEARPVRFSAHLLFGAVCESAMMVARSDDQEAAIKETLDELGRMLGMGQRLGDAAPANSPPPAFAAGLGRGFTSLAPFRPAEQATQTAERLGIA